MSRMTATATATFNLFFESSYVGCYWQSDVVVAILTSTYTENAILIFGNVQTYFSPFSFFWNCARLFISG